MLAAAAQRGDRSARDTLIVRNLPLIQKMIGKAIGVYGEENAEWVAVGVEALLAAARSFDVGRGCKFSTYASHAIIQRVRRAKSEGGLIRVPYYSQPKRATYAQQKAAAAQVVSIHAEDGAAAFDIIAERGANPDQGDEIERVLAALADVPERDQRIVMQYMAGEGYPAIATRFGISRALGWLIVNRTIKRLREQLGG